MKIGRPLAIIVHYMIQFNLEFFKCSGPDRGPSSTIYENYKNLQKTCLILKVKLHDFPTCHSYVNW